MIKNVKKALSVCIALMLVLPLFLNNASLTVLAEGDGSYAGIDPSVLCSVIDVMADDFNLPTVAWTSGNAELEAVSSLDKTPYSPYEGSRSLILTAGEYKAGSKITLSGSASMLSDTAAYKYIAMSVFIPREASGATVKMKLSASKGSISDTKRVAAGSWQTVFFELGNASKGNASKIELTFTFDSSCELYFLIDTVGGCKDKSDLFAARYMTDSFVPSGCEINYGSNLTVSLNGTDAYIESQTPTVAALPSSTAIRVDIKNSSTCRFLTLKYKTIGSEEYDRSVTVDIPDSDGTASCLFNIPEGYIGSFALCFDGSGAGSVELLSIGVSQTFISELYVGKVTECRIARDKKNISIKGEVDQQTADAYEGSRVLLYQLSAFEDAEIISQKTPLSETKLHNGAFAFTVPLDYELNGIYKKYVAAIYSDGSIMPICQETFINNPEILASERTSLPESKKGISPLPNNYVLDGIAQTAIEIKAEELLTLSSENSIRYDVAGSSHLFSSSYLSELDSKMQEYEREGISVRFILRLSQTDDLSLKQLLFHPNASGGRYKAFNTESSEGISALRAITDLLVKRYGSNDGKTDNLIGIVLGSSVNEAFENYNMSDASLSEFAEAYSSALRIVYNTAVSITSGFEVSVPLGGEWYSSSPSGQRASFDARTALEAISTCIKAGGDIGWKLSYDITPEAGKYAWADSSPYFGADARTVTAANLEVLTSFLTLTRFHYNGTSRSVLLLGTEYREAQDENDLISLSADYVYTFLRISARSMKTVSGYIPCHEASYENALRYVESDTFEERSGFVSELIGKDRLNRLIEASVASDRSFVENVAGSIIPSSVKGESVIFDFSPSGVSAAPSLHCVSLENGANLGGSRDWLRVGFEKADPNAFRGFSASFESPLDLSVAPYISFKVRCSSLPQGVDSLEITVAVFSGRNALVSSTVIPISVSDESAVVCDLSSFPHLSSCDRISIYIRGENGEDIGTPDLRISSVKALSETLSDKELEGAIKAGQTSKRTVPLSAVIAVAVITVLAIITEAARLFYKNRAKNENE